ncbi:MAG: MFS transporter, partial [Thermomicrobiales bacterium]
APATPTATLRTARIAAASFFFLNGIASGNWVTRIPDVQRGLRLSDGQLGFALLGAALGALVALPISGWLVARYGSGRMLFAAGAGISLMLPILPIAPSLALFFLALLCYGLVFGTLEVPANAQAVLVETAWGRPLMSSFHAMFSVGGHAGAAMGGVIAGLGVPPFLHLLAVGAALLTMTFFARPHLLPDTTTEHESDHGPIFAIPRGPLLALGAIGFCVLLGEGAMADWSAVYLKTTLQAGATLAAAGYAIFSLTMAGGRLTGDRLTTRFGPERVVRVGGAIAGVGLGAAMLLGGIPAALIGFACVGAGLAAVFPITMGASGRVPGVAPSMALTAVATAGYTGFMIGPPAIGFISDHLGLRAGLGLVAALSLVIMLLAGRVSGATVTAIDDAATRPQAAVPEG